MGQAAITFAGMGAEKESRSASEGEDPAVGVVNGFSGKFSLLKDKNP